MLLIPQVLDDNGVANLSSSGAAASYIRGQSYDSSLDVANATTAAVDATDSYISGFRYTSSGALRLYDATAGLPTPVYYQQGIALTKDGQACYTSAAYNPLDARALDTGLAVTNNGRMYAVVN